MKFLDVQINEWQSKNASTFLTMFRNRCRVDSLWRALHIPWCFTHIRSRVYCDGKFIIFIRINANDWITQYHHVFLSNTEMERIRIILWWIYFDHVGMANIWRNIRIGRKFFLIWRIYSNTIAICEKYTNYRTICRNGECIYYIC
jgi:hypothetical protein